MYMLLLDIGHVCVKSSLDMSRTQALQPRLTRAQGTFGIVVAPTRELCIQINDVLGLILRRFVWLVRADGSCARQWLDASHMRVSITEASTLRWRSARASS